MTNKILIDEAAVWQALEALERLHYEMFPQQGSSLIAALRQALEQPAPAQEPVVWERKAGGLKPLSQVKVLSIRNK
jgi:hypothetical protein